MPDPESDLLYSAVRHVLAVLAHPLGPHEVDQPLVDSMLVESWSTVDGQKVLALLVVNGALTESESDPGRFVVLRPLPQDAVGPVDQDATLMLIYWYVQQAGRADRTLRPHTWRLNPAHDPAFLPSPGHAIAWFEAHRERLLMVLKVAIEQPGQADLAVPLAEALDGLTGWTGHHQDRADVAELGIAALISLHFGPYRVGDEPGRTRRHLVRMAVANARLARARTDLEEYPAAMVAADTALEFAGQSGDPGALAHALDARSRALHAQGDVEAALLDWGQALDADQAQDDVHGEGLRRWRVGRARTARGEHVLALVELRLAADAMEQVGDWVGWAQTLTTTGAVHRVTGDTEAALTVLRQALGVLAGHGAQGHLGDAYAELARTERDRGDVEAALGYFRAAAQHYRLGRREGLAVWVEAESTAT